MRVLRSSLPVMQAWSKFREKADYSNNNEGTRFVK